MYDQQHELVNRVVELAPTEILEAFLVGTVIVASSEAICVRVRSQITLKSGMQTTQYVAKKRYVEQSMNDILDGSWLNCGIYFIPEGRIVATDPLDVTWWRGGGSEVASVRLWKPSNSHEGWDVMYLPL